MVKIDASEYDTNWLIDSPEKEGEPNAPEEGGESDSTPTEENQTQQASKALKSALDSMLSKDKWIPYKGPNDGEGWQNTQDPDDVRYVDEAPGEIADGYEEQAEGWGGSDDVDLSRVFEEVEVREGYRESGGRGGNTTGDEMELLHMPNGNTHYAIPSDAYLGRNQLSIGPREAKINNLDSPKVINALGGKTCSSEIVESPEGEEYIVKEGISGETLGAFDGSIESEEKRQQSLRTAAAAFFVGNADLHRDNMVVNEKSELVIIDNDSAGPYSNGDWMDIVAVPTPFAIGGKIHETIFDMAIALKQGEIELPKDIGETHQSYVEQATEKAIRTAQISDYEGLPEELQRDESAAVDDLRQVDEGDEIKIKNSLVEGGRAEGEVKFANYHEGWLAVWDEQDREYIVESPEEIMEVK